MPGPQLVQVGQAEAGMKLARFIERRLGGTVPGGAVMRWIRTGRVRVDKGRKQPFYKLKLGETVRIPPYEPGEDQPARAFGPVTIVARGQDLLAVAKPPGLPSQPGTGHTDSLSERLKAMEPDTSFPPTLAHRLDRDTSGLVLAATSHARLTELHGLFKTGGVRKTYLAWVKGNWPHSAPLPMEDELEKQGAPGREKVLAGKGKKAESIAAPVVARPEASLLMVRLLTGRTHQLRVQLAQRGHPILGDRKYGGPPAPGMLLHAWRIDLPGESFRLAPDWPGPFGVSGLNRELERALAALNPKAP